MVKFVGRILLGVLLCVALLAGGGALYVWRAYHRPGPAKAETTILIKKGMAISRAADLLRDEGVIGNTWLFKLRFRVSGLNVIRGEYSFPAKASLADVIDKLTKGLTETTKMVIPPALHGWAIQKRLEPFIPEDEFWAMWTDPKFAAMAGFPDAPSLEGLIAPATYDLNLALEPAEIIAEMMKTFHRQVFPTLQGGALPPYQTLILASLAEKETDIPEELPQITGVFYNRLKARMRLQCDPTSLYARWMSGDLRFTKPLREDLDREHPYNTYTVAGLPPSPIAIPSKAAIEAAIAPMETDAFYFVATGSGGHNFSKTLDEHNRNVNTYRSELNRQRRSGGG
jgi:UPF0755 protein